jgi:hypothetical protein
MLPVFLLAYAVRVAKQKLMLFCHRYNPCQATLDVSPINYHHASFLGGLGARSGAGNETFLKPD